MPGEVCIGIVKISYVVLRVAISIGLYGTLY